MNYPYLIPGTQADPASFAANTTLILGTLDKPLDARTLVTVDYSGIIPADTVANYSIRVKPGGDPQLWIEDATVDSTNLLLTFFVSEGIGGGAYEVIVTAKMVSGNIRSDMLTVNVMGEGCACIPMPAYPRGNSVSGDGSVYMNDRPRFFVSLTAPIGAHVLDRWYASATGSIYDYVTNGLTSWWEEATLGGGGGYGANIVKMNPIVPDGVTFEFTLTAVDGTAVDIQTSNNLLVSVDGVWQEPTAQYGASVDIIEFTQPPFADSVVFMLWLSPPPDTPPPPLRAIGEGS
jgi:hypothetical protein